MRILVFSDTHRAVLRLEKEISRYPDIRHIFFLGDIVSDAEDVRCNFPDKIFHIVSGNCDFSASYPTFGTETIENIRIFYCHGHRLNVKYGLEKIKEAAREQNCTLALFGHTHCSLEAYDDGLYIVNPGSLCSSRDGRRPSYAIIDLTPQGICTKTVFI
ncbi:MAG: YfcE family phosphodiesterase [Clostridia bacterium]|nr:YfcE family phosphodiesterase [Clostridia bacterium]